MTSSDRRSPCELAAQLASCYDKATANLFTNHQVLNETHLPSFIGFVLVSYRLREED